MLDAAGKNNGKRKGGCMKYSYFPGCSLKGLGRAYEESLLPVMRHLGVELDRAGRLELLRRDGLYVGRRGTRRRSGRAQPGHRGERPARTT